MKRQFIYVWFIGALMIGSSTFPAIVNGHGGKTHKDSAFTSLDAVKKGILLYDKLLASGKLDETWETNLSSVNIDRINRGEVQEYRVSLERSNGEPQKVFFFFNLEGSYMGSNFTGN